MCGIAGIFSKNIPDTSEYIRKMVFSMQHRGPDAQGFHFDQFFSIGHSRLSIIDLNKRSNQPLYDLTNRYLIVFNGEIYNYKKLKSEIGNRYNFTTNSDTEVLLAAYIVYGIEMLDKLNGCFSFSIYDKRKELLFFARDRLGIKPFYFFRSEDLFIFSSEMKPILKTGLVKYEINNSGLMELFSFQSSKAPNTLVKNIEMLKQGHYGFFCKKTSSLKIKKYWKPKIKSSNHKNNYKSIIENTKLKLLESIERRLMSDVELGSFLSGGIDSSIIVAAMNELNERKKMNTFSLVHKEQEYDESVHSDKIAKLYNTNHYRVSIDKDEIISEISNAISSFDSPSGDGINSYLVSKKIREVGIKVALSGLGGDESFAGYVQFKYWYWYKNYLRKLPNINFSILSNFKNQYLSRIMKLIAKNRNCASFNNIFRNVSGHHAKNLMPTYFLNNDTFKSKSGKELVGSEFSLSEYSLAEINGYTTNVLLKDADQTSMAHGLEVRVPFLDHKLFEHMLSIEDKYKLGKVNKNLLVDTFKDKIPESIYKRKKQGFIVPTNIWMKNELQSISKQNIDIVCDSKIINNDYLQSLWSNYLLSGENGTLLWSIVVLGGWLKENNLAPKVL